MDGGDRNALSVNHALSLRVIEQERSLREANQRLEAIYNASSEGLTLCRAVRDTAGRVVDYQVIELNKAMSDLTGATRDELLGETVGALNPAANARWFSSADRVLRTRATEHFDIRSPVTGRWLNVRVSYVAPEMFQQTFIDVTDRHLLEEQRQHLLQEMHHRVMNNFQMVASFLHVQAVSADPAARAQLQAAKNRVEVLAGLHAMLIDANADGEINMATYIAALCTQLQAVIERPEAITLTCDVEQLELSAEKAVPLGFIVNELVTNAAKYAFPAPRGGTITILLRPLGDAWQLTVADDGIGLAPPPRDKTRQAKSGLGTRLIDSFVRQIGAELTTTSQTPSGHTCLRYDIRFTP